MHLSIDEINYICLAQTVGKHNTFFVNVDTTVMNRNLEPNLENMVKQIVKNSNKTLFGPLKCPASD